MSVSQKLPCDKYISDWFRREGTFWGSGNQRDQNTVLLLFLAESRGSVKSTEIHGCLCLFRCFPHLSLRSAFFNEMVSFTSKQCPEGRAEATSDGSN